MTHWSVFDALFNLNLCRNNRSKAMAKEVFRVRITGGEYYELSRSCRRKRMLQDPNDQLEVLRRAGPYGTAEADLDPLYAARKWGANAFLADFRATMALVLAAAIRNVWVNVGGFVGGMSYHQISFHER
jgi:hypothetical protein